MTRKTMMIATIIVASMTGSLKAQNQQGAKVRDYFPRTSNVKPISRMETVVAADTVQTTAEVEEQKLDFISRNFHYVSMCDWEPGFRFMVKPTQKDLVIKTFADKNGNLVSSKSLENKVLVYRDHSTPNGSLHERVNFYLEGDTTKTYYFEVPTAKFDDYCYSLAGIPTLAYLGDVDMAMDSLVGKRVRVLVRDLYQDSGNDGFSFKPVDIGQEGRNSVMTITKVGVGTRDFPVKIIVKEDDKENGQPGEEYFQNVAISRTNCSYRSDQLEVSNLLPHTFEGSFQLMDDRMAVGGDLYDSYVGKKFFTFYTTQMRNSKEKLVKVLRLSPFTVTDIFRLGNSNTVTVKLKGEKTGETYTKDLSLVNSKVNGSEDILSELLVEGDPEQIEGVRKVNLPAIQQQKVLKGFTEAEVRLALGEPTDITRTTADIYEWTYMFKENSNRPFRSVKFSYKTKKVIQDMTR